MENLHTWDQKFKNMITETGYKHIAMESADGERIVSYNQPKTKISSKFDEIRKRLAVLPDGYYKILCRTNYGNQNKPDTFMILKGKAEKAPLKERDSDDRPVKKTQEQITREEVLSLPEAMKRIEELSNLRVQVENLKQQVEDRDKKISELEDEIDEMENEPLEEAPANDMGSWLEKTMPTVMPFIDKYFEQKDRFLTLQEQKMQRQQPKKPIIIKSRRPRQTPQRTFMDLDLSNEAELNSLFDEMELLSDDQFNEAYETISAKRPELAELIADEFQMGEEVEDEQ